MQFRPFKKLNEMNLKESTKDILTAIYMHYWVDSKKMYTIIIYYLKMKISIKKN